MGGGDLCPKETKKDTWNGEDRCYMRNRQGNEEKKKSMISVLELIKEK